MELYLFVKVTPPKFNIAPENRPGPNRKVVFQPSIFRCYVSFREGMFFLKTNLWKKDVSKVEMKNWELRIQW